MQPFKITIPYKLQSTGNAREHYMTTHRKNKKQISDIAFYIHNQLELYIASIKGFKGKHIITLTRIAPRHLDFDNAVTSFKAIRDYLASKLIPGKAPGQADADESKIEFTYSQEKGKPHEYAIRIEIHTSTKI